MHLDDIEVSQLYFSDECRARSKTPSDETVILNRTSRTQKTPDHCNSDCLFTEKVFRGTKHHP